MYTKSDLQLYMNKPEEWLDPDIDDRLFKAEVDTFVAEILKTVQCQDSYVHVRAQNNGKFACRDVAGEIQKIFTDCKVETLLSSEELEDLYGGKVDSMNEKPLYRQDQFIVVSWIDKDMEEKYLQRIKETQIIYNTANHDWRCKYEHRDDNDDEKIAFMKDFGSIKKKLNEFKGRYTYVNVFD